MVRFIPASDLKPRYAVLGHFYTVQVAPSIAIECRSVLEIVATEDLPSRVSLVSQHKPDAVFVMMNPGSSRPLVEVNNHIHADAVHRLPISLVPTKPDTTQYQVMRIMHYCGWRHVRVLNLSDLRCTQSPAFFKQYQRLELEANYDSHSIFSGRRRQELKAKLTQHQPLPVIRAWGVSPELEPLIERTGLHTSLCPTMRGLPKAGTIDKFLHPLPTLQSQKLAWVSQMVKQCRDRAVPPVEC